MEIERDSTALDDSDASVLELEKARERQPGGTGADDGDVNVLCTMCLHLSPSSMSAFASTRRKRSTRASVRFWYTASSTGTFSARLFATVT